MIVKRIMVGMVRRKKDKGEQEDDRKPPAEEDNMQSLHLPDCESFLERVKKELQLNQNETKEISLACL